MSYSSSVIPAFNIGAAFVRAGRAVLTHGWIPLLLSIIAGLVFFGIAIGVMVLSLSTANGLPVGRVSIDAPWLPLVTMACWAAVVSTSQMLAAQAVHQARVGEKARFSAAFRALWQDGPLAYLLVLGQWLLILVGLVLLVVPGVIFAVLFSMVVAARVANGGGPVRAFRESLNAARGNGWMLALYLLLADIIGVGVVFAGNAAGEMSTRALQALMKSNDPGGPLVIGVAIAVAVGFVTFMAACPFLFGLFPAAAYAELKAARDDRAVASAFD
jgi:hypothetical protein